VLLANLEIGLHEQARLQPEIAEALAAATAAEQGLLRRVLGWPLQRQLTRLSREAITRCLMVLTLPTGTLHLGGNLEITVVAPHNRELEALVSRYEPVAPALDDCGARDWSVLDQRMHFISHLFRGYQARRELAAPPFTPAQVERLRAGVLPDGEL
jgi:hypothetical protein